MCDKLTWKNGYEKMGQIGGAPKLWTSFNPTEKKLCLIVKMIQNNFTCLKYWNMFQLYWEELGCYSEVQ
jgi:hypothetical protein